ncbi:MAG: phosphoglycerate kinase [Bacilli bacterium]|nr:phosphoglycerate kinase [Bacilli bacterium]
MKNIQDIDINGKTVILRCDFNVPLKDGLVDDDSKIVKSLKTINYIIENGGKVVVLSHLGRVKGEEDKRGKSLKVVADYLSTLINKPVVFKSVTRSNSLLEEIKKEPLGSIIMLENTRFEDIPNKLESSNNEALAKYWASLGDIFCLDAFGSAHRSHASTAGIGAFIPSCLGYLMQEELNNLSTLVNAPKRPFTILMGGAKVDDKIKLMENLLPKCDYFLATGGIANSFLKALRFPVGSSLATSDEKIISKLRTFMLEYRNKILLPLDATVGSTYDENYVKYRSIAEIGSNEVIYDIGVKTIAKYKLAIDKSKTIFVNGTCGKYEDTKYANGTMQVFTNLSMSPADIYVGGGDSVSAAKKLGFEGKFKYLSSGGGATLEYLGDGKLEAVEYLKEHANENINA